MLFLVNNGHGFGCFSHASKVKVKPFNSQNESLQALQEYGRPVPLPYLSGNI